MPIRDTERWQRLKQIFEQAMELPPAEADALVKSECAGDREMLEEARKLLTIHRQKSLMLDHRPEMMSLTGLLPDRAVRPGQLLAERFRILNFLGEGGIGEVYEAEDILLQQRLAIKTLHPFHAADPSTQERFKQEIQIARRISHPNICRIHDFYSDAVTFLTMELLEGRTLARRLADDGPLNEEQAFDLLRQLTEGLDEAHRQGVIHRDLKPSNVMLCGDRVVIMDFGLALLEERRTEDGATLPSSTLGTPAYMSPEQLAGHRVSATSDIYSLGILVYEALTGTAPHKGLSPLAIAARRVQEPPPSPRARRPELSRRWDDAVVRALSLKPAERFATASDFLQAVARPQPGWRIQVDRRKLVIGAAALVLAPLAWWLRPSPHATEAARWLRLGQEALDVQATFSASQLLERAVQADPHLTLAAIRLTEAYVQEDRIERAKDQALRVDALLGNWPWSDRWLAKAAAAAKASVLRDHDNAIALYRQLAESAASDRRSSAMLALANQQWQADRFADALQTTESVTSANREYAPGWLRRAAVEAKLDRKDAAIQSLATAQEIFQLQGNQEGLVEVLRLRATLLPIAEARPEAEHALKLARDPMRPSAVVRTLFTLSNVDRLAGRGDQAIRLAEEARRIAADSGMEVLAVQGMIDLANAWSAHYQMKDMERLLRQAVGESESIRAYALANRARFVLAQSLSRLEADHAEVERLLDQSAAFYRESGMRFDLARTLNWRVLLDIRNAAYPQARRSASELADLARRSGNELGALDAEELLAEIDDRAGEFPSALSRYRAAATAHEQAQRLQRAAYDWINGFYSAVRFGDFPTAGDFRQQAVRLQTAMGQPEVAPWKLLRLYEAEWDLAEGRKAEALAKAREVMEWSRNRSAGRALLARAIAARASANVAEAESALADAQRSGQQFIIARAMVRLLETLVAARRLDRAGELMPGFVGNFETKGHLPEKTEAVMLDGAIRGRTPDLSFAEARWGRSALTRFVERPDRRALQKGQR